MNRMPFAAAWGAMLAAGLAQGQPLPQLPETYSYTAKSEGVWPKSTHKVNRNGPKELLEVRNESGDFHIVQLFDFQAHLVYTRDLNAKTCTVQEYTSPYASYLQDPIAGWDEMRREMARGPAPKVLRTEVVNGIRANMIDIDIPESGKYTYWLEEKLGFPVKWTATIGNQPVKVLLEMRDLNYAPSPPSIFVPPAECTRIGGSSSTTGGHVEATLEANVTATIQDGKLAAAASAKLEPVRGKVTAVGLRLDPERYNGPCPSPVKLVGEITVDGPAAVWYEFLAGAVRSRGQAEGTLQFERAGTQRITLEAEYVSTPSVPECLLLAAEVKEDGSHGPETVSSEPAAFNARCGPALPVRK